MRRVGREGVVKVAFAGLETMSSSNREASAVTGLVEVGGEEGGTELETGEG